MPCGRVAPISKVAFSVFDNPDGERPVLVGSTKIDLSYLGNGHHFHEHVPLACVHQWLPASGGFRLNPSICVELRVERRIQPVCEPFNFSAQHSHTVSRSLSRKYDDISQDVAQCPAAAAGT